MCILHTFIVIIFLVWMQVEVSHAAEGVNFFNFLTSISSSKDSQRISFSPDDGKKFRRSFEQRYGPRGRKLIESMGQGPSISVPRTENNTSNGTKHTPKIADPVITSTSSSSASPRSVTSKSSILR